MAEYSSLRLIDKFLFCNSQVTKYFFEYRVFVFLPHFEHTSSWKSNFFVIFFVISLCQVRSVVVLLHSYEFRHISGIANSVDIFVSVKVAVVFIVGIAFPSKTTSFFLRIVAKWHRFCWIFMLLKPSFGNWMLLATDLGS